MSYTAPIFLFVFLPAVLIAYQAASKKWRGKVLLFFSYAFFFCISKTLLIYLIATTLLTHHVGIWIDSLKNLETDKSKEEKKQLKKREKKVMLLGIMILLAILFYFKYWNFTIKNINALAGLFSISLGFVGHKILLPIGISFYTLQAISYMVDVYWGRVKADESLEKTALFLSFFPQIMEGPIARYTDTADTLYQYNPLTMENLREGFIRICWGLFKKMVIADRVSIAVASIFNMHAQYHGFMIVFGAICYTTQLYMEFSGCMDVVIGCGKMFGVILPENFRQPFFAKNATEFWQRWHITLGVWFKNYIFYPVSTSKLIRDWNRFGKKHVGKFATKIVTVAIALFPVWLCNGIWHGAKWSYIFYGMYYFTIIMFDITTEPLRNKIARACHINIQSKGYHVFQILKMWLIVITGEMFFRANGLRCGFQMFISIFHDFSFRPLWDGSLLMLGLDQTDLWLILMGCIFVFFMDLLAEKGHTVVSLIASQSYPVRFIILALLVTAIVVLGAYGEGYQAVDLIYAGF